MKQKRHFLALALASLCSLGAWADGLSESEAQSLAEAFIHGNGPMKAKTANLRLSLAEQTAGHYAYNVGQGGGYVIVASDDNVINPIIGYADEGSFSTTQMPENMKAWLDEIDRQVKLAALGVRPASVDRTGWTAIAPMLTCKWNQDSPYNNLCPTIGTTRCYTGCVATGVAQVMYYHKWPAKGTGTVSYDWEYTQNGSTKTKTLTANLANSTYNWSAMTDTYNSSSSSASKSAVALLMKDVGYACKMGYGTDGSGTSEFYAAQALAENFSYNTGITLCLRDYFTTAEWEKKVYDELVAKRPVIYCGSNFTGGHCFVCDGYSSDGYFHFNWGWGGASDGYFLLSVLDPDVQGIGGSSGSYNYGQSIMTGVDKNTVSTGNEPVICADSIYTVTTSAYNTSTAVIGINGWYNYTTKTLDVTLGLKVVSDADASVTYVKSMSSQGSTDFSYGMSSDNFKVALANFPKTKGTYKVYPVFRTSSSDSWHDVKMRNYCYRPYLNAKVTANKVAFSNADESAILTVSNLSTPTKAYVSSPYKVSATITAKSGSYEGNIYACFLTTSVELLAENAATTYVSLAEGESQTIDLYVTAPSSTGSYYFAIMRDLNDVFDIINYKTVTVSSATTGKLTVTGLKNVKAEAGKTFTLTGTAKATSGAYYGYANIYGYYEDNTAYGTMGRSIVDLKSGSSTTLSVTCTAPSEPGIYTVGVIDNNNYAWASSYVTLTVTEAVSGISSVTEANAGEVQEVFTLDGRSLGKADMKSLDKGIYIVKKDGKTRKVSVAK